MAKNRTINRMDGIVTMVEYTNEDDIKAYELEPTFRELGGGSNDLTIATLNIISELPSWNIALSLPCAFDNEAEIGTCSFSDINAGEPGVFFNPPFNVILYKGKATGTVFYDEQQFDFVVSGNATRENEMGINITGDCTITVISA